MFMPLTVVERMVIPRILPTQGDFRTLRIVKRINAKVELTDDEVEVLNVRQVGDRLHWRDGTEEDVSDEEREILYTLVKEGKEIELEEAELELLREELRKLNDSKRLEMNMISLYEKIVFDAKDADEG